MEAKRVLIPMAAACRQSVFNNFVSGFVSHIEHLWKESALSSFFQRLAGFSRLILFDKRGIGLSDRIGDPPNVENTIDDIHAVTAEDFFLVYYPGLTLPFLTILLKLITMVRGPLTH